MRKVIITKMLNFRVSKSKEKLSVIMVMCYEKKIKKNCLYLGVAKVFKKIFLKVFRVYKFQVKVFLCIICKFIVSICL